MPRIKPLRTHQRVLWTILAWHFPAPICKTLETTSYIHSDELHRLYSILLYARFRTPAYLLSVVQSLRDETAREMVATLADVGIHAPRDPTTSSVYETTRIGGRVTTRAELGYKPLFYDSVREKLWYLVLGLFDAGYIGSNDDGSARESVASFRTLHILYRLDREDQRAGREEDTGLRDPSHTWYHATSVEVVEKWVRRLSPLVERGNHD